MKRGPTTAVETLSSSTSKTSNTSNIPSNSPKLHISDAEWQSAIAYFATHSEIKMDKKIFKDNLHSFIKVDDQIIALANKIEGILGEGGGDSIVKIGQNQKGEVFAVKIEYDERDFDSDEIKILKLRNEFFGKVIREYTDCEDPFKRRYTLIKFQEGKELRKVLSGLTLVQKLIVAIKSSQQIEALHQQNILHCDVKPENLMVIINGNDIQVQPIDFGVSLILNPNEEYKKLDSKGKFANGTPAYMAPETYHHYYSIWGDIYALGKMFCLDLELDNAIYTKMIDRDQNVRPDLHEIIKCLLDALKAQPNLDHHALQVIKELESTKTLNQSRPRPLISLAMLETPQQEASAKDIPQCIPLAKPSQGNAQGIPAIPKVIQQGIPQQCIPLGKPYQCIPVGNAQSTSVIPKVISQGIPQQCIPLGKPYQCIPVVNAQSTSVIPKVIPQGIPQQCIPLGKPYQCISVGKPLQGNTQSISVIPTCIPQGGVQNIPKSVPQSIPVGISQRISQQGNGIPTIPAEIPQGIPTEENSKPGLRNRI